MKKIKLFMGAVALISAISFASCTMPTATENTDKKQTESTETSPEGNKDTSTEDKTETPTTDDKDTPTEDETEKTKEELIAEFNTFFINKIKGANVRLPTFSSDKTTFGPEGIIPISDDTNLTKPGLVTAKKEEASPDDIYSFNYTIRAVRELENETIALTYIEWTNPAENQFDGLHSIVYDKTEDRFYFYFANDGGDDFDFSLIISNENEEFPKPEKDNLKIFSTFIELFCSLEEQFVFTETGEDEAFVKGEQISFGNGVITYKGNTANYEISKDSDDFFIISISNSNLGDFLPEDNYYLEFCPALDNNNNETTINYIYIWRNSIDLCSGPSSLEGLYS